MQRATSLPTIPLSLGTASLSCLAAEHHQIHNQESLDAWRTKALRAIDELYEQKSIQLKHETYVSALIGQLRAIINEEMPRHGNGCLIDNYHTQHAPPVTTDSKE